VRYRLKGAVLYRTLPTPATIPIDGVVGHFSKGIIGTTTDVNFVKKYFREHQIDANYDEMDNPVVVFLQLKLPTTTARSFYRF